MTETSKNFLETMLERHNISRINKFEELKKYFDVDSVDKDGTPKITAEHKVVIIVDNKDFNETYIIDLIDSYLEKHPSVANNVTFLYIDDIDVKKQLLAKNINTTIKLNDKTFEKTYLTPCILTINPIENQFNHFPEAMVPFSYEHICKLLEATKIEE